MQCKILSNKNTAQKVQNSIAKSFYRKPCKTPNEYILWEND